MLYGLYLSTAGAQAQSRRQDVIANNIANVDTAGFRRQLALIAKRSAHETELGAPAPTAPADPNLLGGGVSLASTPTDLATTGAYKQTGRSLDLAIRGEGFFKVRKGEQTYLTRNGSLTVDRQGNLATNDGAAQLLGTNGGPIKLDGSGPIAVGRDGKVTQNDLPIGQIAVVAVEDPNRLRHAGGNLFSHQGEAAPAKAAIDQNVLEGSNVNPVTEMVSLIESARAFEMNISMIQLQNESLTTLLQSVPRLT